MRRSLLLLALGLTAIAIAIQIRAQDPQIIIQCGASLRPVAEVQADGAVKVVCKAATTPTPTPTSTPTPTPTPAPPPANGAVWIATPASLQSLIGKGSPAKPGDQVQLTSGTYLPPRSSEHPIDRFEVHAPGIRIIGVPGAVIDGRTAKYGAVYVAASDVTIEDLRITNTVTDRAAERGAGIEVAGANVVLRRLRVHGCGNGIFASQSALNLLVEDCVIYDNGWTSPARAHGHGVYAQNKEGVKAIRRNVIINNYGAGIHLFGQAGYVDNFLVAENIIANNGRTRERQVLIGGQEPSRGITVARNFIYTPWAEEYQPNAFFGYRPGNDDITIKGNWFIGGTGVYLVGWNRSMVTDNVLAARQRMLTLDATGWEGGAWASNTYYGLGAAPFATQGGLPVKVYEFDAWRVLAGDMTSKFASSLPSDPIWAVIGGAVAYWNCTATDRLLPAVQGRIVDPITEAEIKSCAPGALCVGLIR